MLKTTASPLLNQRGLSTIELIPILMLFALLFNFSLGFFGVIHTGILNSIAARNYTFETFRNRANLTFLRDSADSVQTSEQSFKYSVIGYRFHGIIAEGHPGGTTYWPATLRPIKFTEARTNEIDPVGSANDHSNLVRQVADTGKVSDVFGDGRTGVSPIWVEIQYGICLNKTCAKR